MLTVEQEKARSNYQFLSLGIAGLALTTNLVLKPTWAFFINSAFMGLQAFIICKLIEFAHKNKPPVKKGRGLAGLKSVEREEPYVAQPRSKWFKSNQVLTEDEDT